jgi:uracil-DNA glycosylase family 4
MARKFPGNTFVAPTVPVKSELIVIAEAPGEEEQLQGAPLVGGSGRTFDALAKKAGLKREEMTVVNCINCRPPNNIFPTDPDAKSYISKAEADQAVSQCLKNHVEPVLKGRKYKKAILLGDKALRYIAGKEGIGTWRGSPLPIPSLGPKPLAVPTLHPAYLMREQEMIPVVINDLGKSLDVTPERYNLYPTVEDVAAFTAQEFTFDIETTIPKSRDEAPIVLLVGLTAKDCEGIVVPFRGAYVRELRRIFGQAKAVTGHNCIQFDLPILRHYGIFPDDDCVVWDTMLLHHLRFPNLPHDLEFVGSQFCHKPAWKHDKVSFETYCARDVDVTHQAAKELRQLIREEGLERLYHRVQVPLAKICKLMEETGFAINGSRIEKVREALLTEQQALEQKLPVQLRSYDKEVKRRVLAPPGTLGKSGKPVKYTTEPAVERVTPWRSPEMKKKFLYGHEEPWQLGLDEILDVKTGRVTTGKIALDKLFRKSKNFAIPALKRLNAVDELLTTFCSEEMATTVSKMHPHFNVHGTASGRLSSSDPNLQNIPESARFIYVPSRPGWKIIDVDYSQIENRITAFLAGDKERLRRFEENPDFSEHRYAASLFLGIPYEEVEKDNDKDAPYGKAKRIVHGTNYGMGALKISKLYDMDLKDTKNLQATWKGAIRETIKWGERTAQRAYDDGVLVTPFGRKRWFYTNSYYTESLSFIPQSTAADIIYRAMLALMHERIGWPKERLAGIVNVVEPLPEPARLLIQVHDSLVFECPNEMVDKVCLTIKTVMEQPWPELKGFKIPIGIKVGESWGEAEKYVV